jgi:hypothetical protein
MQGGWLQHARQLSIANDVTIVVELAKLPARIIRGLPGPTPKSETHAVPPTICTQVSIHRRSLLQCYIVKLEMILTCSTPT